MPAEHRPLAQRNQKTIPTGNALQNLGVSNNGTAIFADTKNILSNTGQLISWDVREHKIVKKLPFSKWINNYNLVVSSDGKWIATNENRLDPSFPGVRSSHVTTVRSSDLKQVKTFDLGKNIDIVGFLSLPDDKQHVVVKMLSSIPYENTSTYGKDRFEWLNLETGRIDKTLYYSPARECDKIVFSPDRKYLACLFYSGRFNPRGDDSYGNELERKGFVDIIDPKIGKILWHIAATEKQPVGDPLFFISPTQFISSDTLFDIKTKTAKPWSAVSASRRCLANVPGHSSYALFWTKAGMELRNWKANRVVRRWPTLKKPGRVLFSPDLKMFSFKRDQIIQFWKFDPAWLK